MVGEVRPILSLQPGGAITCQLALTWSALCAAVPAGGVVGDRYAERDMPTQSLSEGAPGLRAYATPDCIDATYPRTSDAGSE